jgi:hypothetical protein
MEKAFDGMKTDMEQLRRRWEQVQSWLVAEVERTNAENARLNQAVSDQHVELDKARRERDAAERRHRQTQAELGFVSPSEEKLRLAWVSNGNRLFTDKYYPQVVSDFDYRLPDNSGYA